MNKPGQALGWLVWVALSANGAPSHLLSPAVTENLARLPLAFEKQGERFVARGRGYVVGVAKGKVLIGAGIRDKSGHVVSLEFAGSTASRAIPGSELPGKINYIRGNDPRKWQIGVPTYARVTYPNTYPGIDVVYRGNQQQLEFDLVVRPGADTEAIRLKLGGAGKLSIDGSGALDLGEVAGGLRIALPRIYQEVNGSKKSVPGHYAIVGRDEVAFRIDPWDRTRPLVIDPTIVYSVLLGGGLGSNGANAIGLDSQGNILITGYTYAADFPVLNAAQNALNGSPNVIVTKINPAGTALVYSTYFGGSGNDYANGLAVDSTGAAWVTGATQSSDFPVLNAAYATHSGVSTDGFVARFNAAGVLQFSTFLGGNAAEYGAGIAVDGSNNGYATGRTNGSFPTTAGVIGTANPGFDGFVTKYGPTGAVAWSTLLGGGNTSGSAIAVDSLGDAYVTGTSADSAFPGAPSGGAQTTNKGNGDAFVAKLNPTATAMLYFTFLGGTGSDSGTAIGVDTSFNAYVAGTTTSNGLASAGAAQTALPGAANGFAAKLNPSGSAFAYVTYLGGSRVDYLNGLAPDGSGNVYLAGTTDSTNFPAVSALDATLPGNGISLFNSTNSGGSWAAFDANTPGAVFDVSINSPGTSAVVLTESGIYRTVNGGASWTQQLALQPSQATRSGFHLGRSLAASQTIYAAVCCSSIYQSTNDGQTWTLMGTVSGQAQGIVADPLTADTVYLFGSTAPYLYASTNGGTTWNPAATGLPGTQVTTMAAAPVGALYAGTAGAGIYKSTNHGGLWTAVNTGLPANANAQANSLSASGTAVFFADGSIYQTNTGSITWIVTAGGNIGAGQIAESAQNPSILYAFTNEGTVLESSNGGGGWSLPGTGLPAGISYSNSELVVDPSNSAHVLVVTAVNQAGFVAKLNSAGSALTWSTYLGGTVATDLQAVATDGLGDAFVTGFTSGGSFPVTSPALPAGTVDIFLTKISDATAACSTLSVSPETAMAPQNGGILTFIVVSPSGCAWTATTNQSWAVITSGASGSGSGTVVVQTVSDSGNATQSAVLTVGSQNATITQPGGSCVYSPDKSSYPVAYDGGTVSVMLTATAGCPWSVTNNYSSAISITSNASGTGSAEIGIKVGRNLTGSARNFSLPVGTAQIQIAQAAEATPSGTATTTTLSSSGNPSTFGKVLTLTATVSPAAATGKVTFYAGSTVLGIGTLAGGEATLATIPPYSGKQALRAYYQGGGGYGSSSSSTLSQTVAPMASASFAAQVTFGAGNGPYSVAVGDFNGDGIADVAVANSDDSDVSVLLGNGNGTFKTAVNYGTGNGPHSVIVGDFNGDGKLDLATANHFGGNVSVLLGNGDGTFKPAAGYAAGINPWTVVAGDFNGDGKIDLAVTNYGGGNVSVLLGNGDGTFAAAVNYGAGAAPIGAVIGDFNGDGITDLAVANNGAGNVSILLGNGDGSFQSAVDYSAGLSPYSVVVSDFNGDGKADLAALGSTSVAVLFGNGDGSFQPAVAYGTFISPIGLAVGDFNADGIPDLVAADDGGDVVDVLLGKGDGTFLAPYTYSAGAGSLSVAVADLNGDGIPDLITGNIAGADISVLLGLAPLLSQTITFGTLSSVSFGTPPFTVSATASTRLPVTFFSTTTAVCTVAGTTVSIGGLGTCSITAAQPGTQSYGAAAPVTRSFTVTPGSQTITFGTLSNVAVGSAPFTLSATATSGLAVTFASTTNAVCTVAGTTATIVALGTCAITATQGGNADYAEASPVTQSFFVAAGSQTIVFEPVQNQPLGTAPFPLQATATSGLAVTLVSNTTPVCTVSGNTVTLAATGYCSITASQAGNAGFSPATPVTRGFDVTAALNPSGTLAGAPGSPFAVGTNPNSVAVGDFNGDGVPDIAVANAGDNTVTVLVGNGSGGFTPATGSPFAVGTYPYSIAVGDFNGDGIADLATANYHGNNVTVLLGSGSGGFTAAAGSPFAVGALPLSVAVGDFNRDGMPDIAAANYIDGTVTVLLGNGSGGFTAATGSPFAVGNAPTSLVVGDFNGDGIPDIATSNDYLTGTVNVLLGNGSGGFTAAPGSPFATGSEPLSVVAGNFNGDSMLDLATANSSGNSVTVLLGNGSGGFTAEAPIAVGAAPASLVVGDFNGDGIPDLAAANETSDSVTVLLGNGSGGFAAAAGSPGFTAGTSPVSVAVGDFNGDGRPDLAAANAGGNNVTVLLGALAGTSSLLSTTSPAMITLGAAVPLSLAVSDNVTAFNAPTGAVTFLDGTTTIGTASQTANPWTFSASSLAVGSHTLTANYSGDTRNLSSVSNGITIQVNGMPQTITFGPLDNQLLSSSPPPLSATASSGLQVMFASNSTSVCTLSGVDITLAAAGTCSITASQPGNSIYAAATPVTQTFVVLASVLPVAAFLDQNGAPALTFNGSTNFPDAGGFLIGAPGVTEDMNGNVYVVGLDDAGGVHLNSYSFATSAWNGWQYSGGILDTSSGLTAAVDPSGVVWFTGRDIGNRFWINSWNGSNFGGWILLDQGIFASDSVPQIAIPSDGSIYVIGKDIGGRIWSNSYIPSSQTFTGWVDRQAVMIGQPSATAGQDGMVYVAVRSVSSESPVYITQIPAQNAAAANTWQNGGGLIDTDPYITSQGGTVYLTALADGGTVYLLTFTESDQTFGTWSFTNGILNDETIAAAAGNAYIAGRDGSGRIYWYSVAGNSWFLAGGAGISSTVLTGGK